MSKQLLILTALIAMLLAGCARTSSASRGGRLLVWHNWPDPESLILEDVLSDYNELFPEIELIVEYVPEGELHDRFKEQVGSGLGPDVLIGVQSFQILQFVGDGFLLDLTTVDFQSDQLRSKALRALEINERLYAAPFSGFTDVMYFNQGAIEEPVIALSQLMEVSELEQRIGIPLDFFDAYWGIDAFEGNIFSEDGSRIDPNEGFVEWLRWLLAAQSHQNIIFDNDYTELRDSFIRGELEYFIGNSAELPFMRAAMSEEAVGVANIPAGINETPGGFLQIETLAINRFSAEKALAIDMINFLTNRPIQRRIARSGLGRIPINQGVRIDPRISPVEAALLRQELRASVLPVTQSETQNALFLLGDEVYQQVMQGIVTPDEAAELLREQVDEVEEEEASE